MIALLQFSRSLRIQIPDIHRVHSVSGSNAGGRSSAVTGSVQRSTVTSSNRAHSATRRINRQQQQEQQQPQLQQQPRIPLGSLRSSDEHGSRASSAQDSCDNSNDSGLGFEDRQLHLTNANVSYSYICTRSFN